MNPLTISTVIPNLNMGKFIASALESIATQSRPVDEVIVVDNQSADNSLEIIETFRHRFPRFTVLSHDERNPAAVRNVGIRAARSEAIAFLDADDLWHQEKMAIQATRLESNSPVDAVGSHICFFDQQHPTLPLPLPSENAQTKTSVAPSIESLLIRRSTLEQLGFLNEKLLYGEDWDLYFRLKDESIPFVIQKYVSVFARRHSESMMANKHPRIEQDVTRAFMQSILRRRKLGLGAEGSKDFSEFEEAI